MPPAQGDGYILKQRVSLAEAIGGALGGNGCCEVENIYDLFNMQGQKVYEVREESGCCCRWCCTPVHKFVLKVYDAGQPNPQQSRPVMSAFHPFKSPPCCCVCLDMCRSEIQVYDGDIGGVDDDEKRMALKPIGFIKQPNCGGGFSPTVQVWETANNDGQGNITTDKPPAYTVKGPMCCIGGLCGEMCCDTEFGVWAGENTEGEAKASIKKLAGTREGMEGVMKELATDSDTFQIEMPAGAGPGSKTGLLMTTLLIDYMFFESGNNIRCEDGGLVCVCTNFYCCGCIAPCTIKLTGNNGGE